MKTRKKKIIIGITATVVLLAASEALSKFYLGLGTPPLYISHPTIEYMLKPNQTLYRFGNQFIVNMYGMRSESFAQEKKNSELRVMVFGDSVVNGGNLSDQKHLATSILKEKLEEGFQKDVVVGNISAGSWGPGNWLAYAQEFGFFDADIVILVISSHDYTDNPTFEPLSKETQPIQKPFSALSEGLFRYLPHYVSMIKPKNYTQRKKIDINETDKAEIIRSLKDLENFLQLAEEQADSVLVYQHWTQAESQNNIAAPGYQIIKQACDKIGIKTLSLSPAFQQAINNESNPYRDHIHPNDVGQELIGDALLEGRT